jgi:hypothetical protein
VNVPEIHDIVKQADVFAMGFRLFSERLLIDTRFDAGDPEGPCASSEDAPRGKLSAAPPGRERPSVRGGQTLLELRSPSACC